MRIVSLLILTGLVACSSAGEAMQMRRVMPPAVLDCDRNELTSYTGVATRYSRSDTVVTVTIDTDDGTTESVSVDVADGDWSSAFLINSEPHDDPLSIIEEKSGTLKAGMRVIAWVCGDEDVTLDWRPASH